VEDILSKHDTPREREQMKKKKKKKKKNEGYMRCSISG